MGYTDWGRLAFATLCTFTLSACLLTPGKFDSTLDIRADRSFAFTYKGEVIATNPADAMKPALEDGPGKNGSGIAPKESAYFEQIALSAPMRSIAAPTSKSKDGGQGIFLKSQDQTAKMQAIAAALGKEKGFRSAVYKGDGKFLIDYAINGSLSHAFMWPFNSDAQAIIPFIAVELRGDDRVRVKAPGYANASKQSGGMSGMGGGDGAADAAKALDGRFTLTTDAEIVSHNQEDGPTNIAGRQQLLWKVDPLTDDAPMAVIRFPAR